MRQIKEGKWYTIPKKGIRVTCCDCGTQHTVEFKFFGDIGDILKYRAFKIINKTRKCSGCRKLKVMQSGTTRCRQCFENKNL